MSLVIEIGSNGQMRVSIDGVVIGLIRSLDVHVSAEEVRPRISIVMNNARAFPDACFAAQLQQALDSFKQALCAHPFIEVSDYHDTLPQGMAVVHVNKEE